MRYLIWPSLLATGLQLIGQIGRSEVFVTGYGTSVVMTPDLRRRTPLWAVMAAVGAYLLFVIVGPLVCGIAALALGGPLGAGILMITGAYLVAVIVSPLLAAHPQARTLDLRAAMRDLPRAGTGVVQLHDLVRHPRDPAGTGVALLHAAIRDPRFASATIITTAAHVRLAVAYEQAGMTRSAGTTTLIRSPQRTGMS